MTPEAFNTFFSICIGFALAGALVNGYQALAQRPAGFGLLQDGVAPKTFAAVPFLVFAAPFIIMRNTLRGVRVESRRVEFVMMATVIAGFWSMMSGTFFLMTLRAAGVLAFDARAPRAARQRGPCLQAARFAMPGSSLTGDLHGDLRARRAGARSSRGRQLFHRGDRHRDRPRAPEAGRERLVRRGAARRQ